MNKKIFFFYVCLLILLMFLLILVNGSYPVNGANFGPTPTHAPEECCANYLSMCSYHSYFPLVFK